MREFPDIIYEISTMADFDSPSVPETDISLSVAMKTAFRVAIIFLSFYLLQRFADFGTTVPPSIEAVFRILSVVLVSGLVIRSEKKKYPNQNLSDEAFMSTAFFYGITLASLYAIQIGVIAAELFGNGGMTFQEEIRFVL